MVAGYGESLGLDEKEVEGTRWTDSDPVMRR